MNGGAHDAGPRRADRTLGCAEVEAALPAIAEGTLDADGDPGVFDHLARCASCQEALAGQDLISLALGGAARDPKPAPVPLLVHLRVPLPIALAAAAGLALSAVLVWQGAGATPASRSTVAVRASEPAPPAATLPTSLTATVPDLVRGPDREVIRIDRPGGRPYYLIVEGDRMALVEPPAESDPPPARSSAVTVGLTRY